MKQVVHRGDVFYAELNSGRGSVQKGIRPIVVVSNQLCNLHSPVISVVCLSTSRTKRNLPTHVPLLATETGLKYDSICLCEQPMSIDKTDLKEYITRLNANQMVQIDAGLRCQLAL